MKYLEIKTQVNFFISNPFHNILKREATALNIPVSAYTRRIIEEYILEHFPGEVTEEDIVSHTKGSQGHSPPSCRTGRNKRLSITMNIENRKRLKEIAPLRGEVLVFEKAIEDFRLSGEKLELSVMTYSERKKQADKRSIAVYYVLESVFEYIYSLSKSTGCSRSAIVDYIIDWWIKKRNDHEI